MKYTHFMYGDWGRRENRVGSDEYVIYAERDLLSVDIFIWEFK